MTDPKTHTFTAPGAVITYDVREVADSDQPPLLLFGSPMEASYFETLAGYFADRTVVTYDPRGADRSKRTDGATSTTPDEHVEDLHRLVDELGGGPIDLFGTSGGGVNLLAFVAAHPEQARVAVVHEPPASAQLPDRDMALAVCDDIRATYDREGFGPAMAKFIALVSHEGEIPADYLDRPAPDPAAFGLPTADDGSRDDPLMQNMVACNRYEHDFDAIRAASTRVVIAVGVESTRIVPGRGGKAVADLLGIPVADFPSHHAGFVGGDGPMAGEPEAFAAKLREVLAAG